MFIVDKSLNNCPSEWHSVWEPMSAFRHRKLKKKLQRRVILTHHILKFEKSYIPSFGKRRVCGEQAEKKVNYLYLKNIIFNSQDYSPIIVKENNDCLFKKIAAVYNQRRLVKSSV